MKRHPENDIQIIPAKRQKIRAGFPYETPDSFVKFICQSASLSQIKKAIQENIELINQPDHTGKTPLMATLTHYPFSVLLDAFELLLQHGADLKISSTFLALSNERLSPLDYIFLFKIDRLNDPDLQKSLLHLVQQYKDCANIPSANQKQTSIIQSQANSNMAILDEEFSFTIDEMFSLPEFELPLHWQFNSPTCDNIHTSPDETNQVDCSEVTANESNDFAQELLETEVKQYSKF